MQNQNPNGEVIFDCYQYSFSPLLLFTSDGYFEEGFSNYNAVAQFFKDQINVDMEAGVLFDRKNMHYDQLYDLCVNQKLLVICCIEQHFTAFKVCNSGQILYYDPLKSKVVLIEGESSCIQFIFFKILKCNYADSQHILENEDYYKGNKSNDLRRQLYRIWKNINDITLNRLALKTTDISLNLDQYYFINSDRSYSDMSTQATDNTCYFQVYLFALLIKVGEADIYGRSVKINKIDQLRKSSIRICEYLLEFFSDRNGTMRPYTNNNVVLDFYRYKDSIYYQKVQQYLKNTLDYKQQYTKLIDIFTQNQVIQKFQYFIVEEKMASTKNTKELSYVCDVEDSTHKLCTYNYYKYRPINMMFGFHANIIRKCKGFYQFSSLRKNFLLSVYSKIKTNYEHGLTKYKEYYFNAQFEIGQQELRDVHNHIYLVDMVSLMKQPPDEIKKYISKFNEQIVDLLLFSTQQPADYEKIMDKEQFLRSKYYQFYLDKFMSIEYFKQFVPLGFNQFNEKEKDKNALTHTVLYNVNLMEQYMHRMSYEFERECINQMAKSNLRKYTIEFDEKQDDQQEYQVQLNVGFGITYSKYNTLTHFLSVIQGYWGNADINGVQVFGKDVTTMIAFVSQKITFSQHEYYHYGSMVDSQQSYYSTKFDLLLGKEAQNLVPMVSQKTRDNQRYLQITDCVFGYDFLQQQLKKILKQFKNKIKSDDLLINLGLLNLLLDFNLYESYRQLLNLDFLQIKQDEYSDKFQLQVKISNLISEHDKESKDHIQCSHIQSLIQESSYKFIVKKNFDQQSIQYKLLNLMNSDPQLYQKLILLCKIYMSLCQINKSVELEYYKIKYDGEYKIVIPYNFSKKTGEYLEQITSEYNFYMDENHSLCHDKMQIFDFRLAQPEINLYKTKVLSNNKRIQTMYSYIEISNCFYTSDSQLIIFVAGNLLKLTINNSLKEELQSKDLTPMKLVLNRVPVEFTTSFVNKAMSMIPVFKFIDNQDLILLSSQNIYHHVDTAGQFNDNYYGMKHPLIDNIVIIQGFVDANDSNQFQMYKLGELLKESKTLLYYPKYELQISSKQQLISLIDYAIKIHNISMFILLMFYLYRTTINISYTVKEGKVKKITGPWYKSLEYVVNGKENKHYDDIFIEQFFQINQYCELPIREFIDKLCENFQFSQKLNDQGQPQIIPTEKQKQFLLKLIKGESFHFSEVGSGKSKVIVPIFCQMFLSNHMETHKYLAKSNSNQMKTCLFLIVPEHLVIDARNQVFRYCLNLNFRKDYKIMDDVFNLLNEKVQISEKQKIIFISSFTDFKKILTYDIISKKIRDKQDNILVLIDEVDDFLDREKLIFNICSNKVNDFDSQVIQDYFSISQAVYDKSQQPQNIQSKNSQYWNSLFYKFQQIHEDVQHKSKSINKSFGIFNEQTLKHCSSNIAYDIEGYKSLIARPYESVNRAMPGSYYSDVERTIYLTYYILREDVAKYDQLFQAERKFISFDYYQQNILHIDFDELIYGNNQLHHILISHPETKDGIIKFLYSIILNKMEIQDKSRSVNSIDIIFNFDCKGFTGTPFIDNYPTYPYIKKRLNETIPSLIYKDFYLHGNNQNVNSEWDEKFKQFQGDNHNIFIKYQNSSFLQTIDNENDLLIKLFKQQKKESFNCIVDLCGIFKRITIQGIKQSILQSKYMKNFKYIYYIDQTTLSDRILYVNNENDVQYDEDFIRRHTNHHQAEFSSFIFFFIDNRNFKGKDIPYQIPFKQQFNKPLINTSIILAHDVDDFSSIWQAMGRSRTMNDTKYIIYKNQLIQQQQSSDDMIDINQSEYINIIDCQISKQLYIKNCDTKVAGNLSSIYQTLISLYNLTEGKYYYDNEMVNVFIMKMDSSIIQKLQKHASKICDAIIGANFYKNILRQILQDKLQITDNLKQLRQDELNQDLKSVGMGQLLSHIIYSIIYHKYEQRTQSDDIMDDLICFLSGEQRDLHEYSYTKQQQKQKQTQANKNQDNDVMQNFKKEQQIQMQFNSDDYYNATMPHPQKKDKVKSILNYPIMGKEILLIKYIFNGDSKYIRVFPTFQFIYSEYIVGDYITQEVHQSLKNIDSLSINKQLLQIRNQDFQQNIQKETNKTIQVIDNYIRANAQFSLIYMGQDIYIIGMKNQFSSITIHNFEIQQDVKFISDEVGFILFNNTEHPQKESDIQNTPYCLSLYLILDKINKQELTKNVIEYYEKNYETLWQSVLKYKHKQGIGFICWRFIMNQQQFKL